MFTFPRFHVYSLVGILIVWSLPAQAQYRPGGTTPVLWFDGNQGATIVAAGTDSTVTNWRAATGSEDQLLPATAAPGSYSVVQATAANRPMLMDTALWGVGAGNRTLRFRSAESDFLAFANVARIPTVNNNPAGFPGKMVSVAFSPTSIGSRMILYKEGDENVGFNLYIETTGRVSAAIWNSATNFQSVTSVGVLAAGTKHIATARFYNQELYLTVDGALIGKSGSLGGPLGDHATLTSVIGRSDGGGTGGTRVTPGVNGTAIAAGSYFNGHIAELVYANTGNAVTQVMWENYLAEKWGISMGANDRFVPTPASCTYDLVGIGRIDASNILSETEFGSAGLYLRDLTTIIDNGDFLLAANNNASGFTTTGTNAGYLNRVWTLYSINGGGSGEGNVTLMFDPIEEGSTTALLNPYDYYLLVDGAQVGYHQGYIESGRICFNVSLSAVKNKSITLATAYTIGYPSLRYQPGGNTTARFWYTATASQQRVRHGQSSILRLFDQSNNFFDARMPNAATLLEYRFTDILPSYKKDSLGTGAHAIKFDVQAPATGDVMHVLSAVSGQPDDLNSLSYDAKMMVAYFRPLNSTGFTGKQVIYEQGTSVNGFNIYLFNTAGVDSIYTGAWNTNGTLFNIYQRSPLAANNTTRYLLTWTFSRTTWGRIYTHVDGTQVGSTLIGGNPLLAVAGDNVGVGGIYNGTRHHDDAVGAITSATGERFEGYIGELIHYTSDQLTLRRIVENYIAAKYNHPISNSLFNLAAAGGCTQELIGIGRTLSTTDRLTTVGAPSGGMFMTNTTYLANDGDFLLAAHNNAMGTKAYNGVNGQVWEKLWYIDATDAAPTSGGTVQIAFAIDIEGSDRQLYQANQYFIRDSTNHTEIGLGTAAIVTISGTDRRIRFSLNANLIADRFITLGVKDRTLPVQCNCTTGDDDADGASFATDTDCTGRWACTGDFNFTEFSAGGDPSQVTSLRKMEPGSSVTYSNIGLTSLLRKLDATGISRRDSLVYGLISEGLEINQLVRVKQDGTAIRMGIPQAGSTTFPAGASGFLAGDGMMLNDRIAYAFANNTTGATKYIGIIRFDGFTKPTVTHYSAMSFSDAPAGVPNFTDMAFDPSAEFNTNLRAYAYDVNDQKLIRIHAETGLATRISAAAQPYSDIEAMYFTEFGELYGWGVNGAARELVHINKTDGTMTLVGTGTDLGQIDGCGCGSGLGIRVYPVDVDNITPITAVDPSTTARYRVDMINGADVDFTNISFAETFSDGREFTSFIPFGSTQPNVSINGGGVGVLTFTASNAIAITGLQALRGASTGPVITSFILTVTIPGALAGATVYTQPVVSNLLTRLGGTKSTDYVISSPANSEYTASNAALRDRTPLLINAPTPVEWASFEAYPDQHQVLLEWATYREENNDYFTVERSINNHDWAEIGRVKGAGTTSDVRFYTLTDVAPEEGVNHYRIRQTDFDGHSSVSNVRMVTFSAANGLGLFTYPNPALPEDLLTVQFIAEAGKQHYEVQMLDLTGKVIFYQDILSEEGRNMVQVPLGQLSSGIYLIHVSSESSSATQKLILR